MKVTILWTIFFLLYNQVAGFATYTVISGRRDSAFYNDVNFIESHHSDSFTVVQCASVCESVNNCGGFNYCDLIGNKTCDAVLTSVEPMDTRKISWAPGCWYFHKAVDQCQNGGVAVGNNSCSCPVGYKGQFCENFVRDCAEAYYLGLYREQTITIQPDPDMISFRVRCHNTDAPTTRIFTRIQNYTDYFEGKGWWNYKNGISYPSKYNSWIGLEKLHLILSNSPYNHTARVTVIFQNITMSYTGYYGDFYVQDEALGYTLTYNNFTTGEYPLEDGFSGSGHNDSINGQPFCLSTNDCWDCAGNSSSLWWFGTGCVYVNPAVPLSELVWPNDSAMAPVEMLLIEIIANIP